MPPKMVGLICDQSVCWDTSNSSLNFISSVKLGISDSSANSPPVDVGEGLDRLVVGVALFDRRVERLEEPFERDAHVLWLDVPQVVQERVLGEELRILAEQAEHQAYAQDVEGLLALFGLRIDILRLQQGVQFADETARLHRDLLLAFGSAVGGVGDEIQ